MSKYKLTPVSWTELVKRFRLFNFDGPYQGGKHPYMIKDNLVLTIPNPHRKKNKRRSSFTNFETS